MRVRIQAYILMRLWSTNLYMLSSFWISLSWPRHTPAQNHRTTRLVTRNANNLVMMLACNKSLPTVANLQNFQGSESLRKTEETGIKVLNYWDYIWIYQSSFCFSKEGALTKLSIQCSCKNLDMLRNQGKGLRGYT